MNEIEMAFGKGATLIKDHLPELRGHAQLWHLDPPLKDTSWLDGSETEHEYVVVSGVYAMFSGPETYIFPANSEGEITDWGELNGSFQGSIDHEQALHNAGYTTLTYQHATA